RHGRHRDKRGRRVPRQGPMELERGPSARLGSPSPGRRIEVRSGDRSRHDTSLLLPRPRWRMRECVRSPSEFQMPASGRSLNEVTTMDALRAFAVVAGLLTLVPGLDTALVLRSSLTQSRRYAWATAAGIATGAMAWGVAAAVGISALLTASEVAYRALTT